MKKTLRRKTWRERIIASGKSDPLICPHCETYYEYKGEVCKENGTLTIKVALCKPTKAYLERMIHYFSSQQTTQEEKEIDSIQTKGTHQVCVLAL
ncbi:hypothetical protein MHB44_20600 [Lysinibacillus sp. FSL H8-0500]|uniref:hypothetical protein n=1 Tax=Lysinibacillus sp. FSL H8-0500 TaxID=2921393 RepID=UPI00310187E1